MTTLAQSRRSLYSFMRKETQHLLRDRQTLAILLLLPLAQVLLFGFAVRTDISDVRVGIVAAAAEPTVATLRQRFAGSGRFSLLPPITTQEQLEQQFRRGDIDVGIIVPPSAARSRHAAEALTVLVITDASDPNTGTTMQNYAMAAIREWQASLGLNASVVRIESRTRMRFNPTLESVNLFVPGLIALILTMVTSLMTALSLSREKERGTFELLLVSPLQPWQIIVGKVLPYLGLAMMNVVSVLLAATLVFDVPFEGSVLLLLSASVLFSLVSLSLGVLIAAVTTSQLAATLAALGGTMMPSTMLSGLIFPITSMPEVLQWASVIVPGRWFIDIVRGVMLKGVGVETLWPQLVILTVMLAVLLVAAIRKTSVRLT